MKKLLLAFFVGLGINAQAQYWQQSVHYDVYSTGDAGNHWWEGS